MLEFDEWDDDRADDLPESDLDEDEFVQCSECRASIYEDTDICPHCGFYQISDTRPWSHKPYWKFAIALSLLAIVGLLWFSISAIWQELFD